jgi:hypothetical protein
MKPLPPPNRPRTVSAESVATQAHHP